MSRNITLGLVSLLGCYQTLPTRELPATTAPTLIAGPLAPGLGRILVDVAEGPSVVSRVVGAGATGNTFERLCITPCYVDLPLGVQEVSLTLQKQQKVIRYLPKTALLTFKAEPYAYRASLDRQDVSAKLLVAALSVAFGAISTSVGLPIYISERRDLNNPDLFDPQRQQREAKNTGIFFGISAAVTVVGLAAILLPPKPIKQKSTSVEFALGPEAIGAPTKEASPLGELVIPSGEREEKAEAIYRQAEAHYHIQDYESALKGFQEAYLLSQAPDLLLNIGQCYRRMKRKEEAITSYRTYLQTFPDSPYRAEVEGMINELSSTK
jgi:tetratricopeptide (TPR) repeat protein